MKIYIWEGVLNGWMTDGFVMVIASSLESAREKALAISEIYNNEIFYPLTGRDEDFIKSYAPRIIEISEDFSYFGYGAD